MPKPRNWNWNPTAQRWEQKGRDGLVKAYSDEAGLGANRMSVPTALDIGGGTNIQYVLGFVGTSALLTSVDVGETTVGTITNATGLVAGDKILGVPKALTLQTGRLGVAEFYVPTNNVLNVHVANLGTVAGSLPAIGWDIVAIRTA